MKKRIFVSYSSPDKAKADAMCGALEAAGLSCWIAPRDLSAGTQWGAGIVKALDECEAVLVVFSAAANNSPQVAREMEIAVSKRRPLIPVRVADDQPTHDMQYFLGVSHWFNAYEKPIESYLPELVLSVHRLLADQNRPWTRFRQRLPQSRTGLMIAVAAGVVVLALAMAWIMKPRFPSSENPLAGRWETTMDDGKGGKTDCQFDVQSMGLAAFSDSCPQPLTSANGGSINVMRDNTASPDQYKSGDSGTYNFIGGSFNGWNGAFRFGWFGRMTTRDATHGEIVWHRIKQDGTLKSGMDDIVAQPAPWPLKDMPGIAKRSTAYVRSKWEPDAFLTSIDVKLLKENEGGVQNIKSTAGGVDLKMSYYSPSKQTVLWFEPMAQYMPFDFGGVQQLGANGKGPLPDDFVDLPDAVAILKQQGMQSNQIYEAQIEDWNADGAIHGVPMQGVKWMIDTPFDERFLVPATK